MVGHDRAPLRPSDVSLTLSLMPETNDPMFGPDAKTPREAVCSVRRHAYASGLPRDDIAELMADVEAAVQAGLWSLTVEQMDGLCQWSEGAQGDPMVPMSGDHRPRHGRLYARGTDL